MAKQQQKEQLFNRQLGGKVYAHQKLGRSFKEDTRVDAGDIPQQKEGYAHSESAKASAEAVPERQLESKVEQAHAELADDQQGEIDERHESYRPINNKSSPEVSPEALPVEPD